jgi:LPS-assembly protein
LHQVFTITIPKLYWCLLSLSTLTLFIPGFIMAQDANPVERQVINPITDTPYVNPLSQDPLITPPQTTKTNVSPPPNIEDLQIVADKETSSGTKEAAIVVYEGNVDARIGIYRLQADKVTFYKATSKIFAEGNVVFDHGQQRITGSRAEWNAATKLGYFINSTGFTNRTSDGTTLYFTADHVEKISIDTIIATNAEVTACEDTVPKWSFKARRVRIKMNDRVKIIVPNFRVKGFPVVYMPYASISIKKQDRASGFLTPSFSYSPSKGFRLSNAYFQTLGRSADITFRNEIYTARGVGFGAELRTRANSRSFLNVGFFGVKDRIFGTKQGPDQGGTSLFVDGVHYFPNGFMAAADVDITSSLNFRYMFSDSIQQTINPEERSRLFVNKNFGDYSLNILAQTQDTSVGDSRVRVRQAPSFIFEKRPSAVNFLKKLPLYFSFESGIEGVSRKESVGNLIAFRNDVGGDPIFTPSIVSRLDLLTQFSLPINFQGWTLTPTAGVRATHYSNSIDPATRLVLDKDITRGYGEFELDLRPPTLARNFHPGKTFMFRHTIEPYIIYRRIKGIDNFQRIILFDAKDAIADTNEIEYGLINRFFTRRSTENVSGRVMEAGTNSKPLASQPYEALTITIRGKYFFDPTFGGALLPGRRNQFYPIYTLSGFSYGGTERRYSPLNIDLRFRPRASIFADARADIGTYGDGLRDLAVSLGLSRPLFQAYQTFYYTRAVTPSLTLSRFRDIRGKEPGTLEGSQWSPSIFLGNQGRGLFGGMSVFFDFQKRQRASAFISSVTTVGYTFDCCSVTLQNYTFNIGPRQENRIQFSFRLNGLGTFGTEQVGQKIGR